jgi:hypothetical protein
LARAFSCCSGVRLWCALIQSPGRRIEPAGGAFFWVAGACGGEACAPPCPLAVRLSRLDKTINPKILALVICAVSFPKFYATFSEPQGPSHLLAR